MDNLIPISVEIIEKLEHKREKYPNFINLRVNKLNQSINDFIMAKKSLENEIKECSYVENKIDEILKKDITPEDLITLHILTQL